MFYTKKTNPRLPTAPKMMLLKKCRCGRLWLSTGSLGSAANPLPPTDTACSPGSRVREWTSSSSLAAGVGSGSAEGLLLRPELHSPPAVLPHSSLLLTTAEEFLRDCRAKLPPSWEPPTRVPGRNHCHSNALFTNQTCDFQHWALF